MKSVGNKQQDKQQQDIMVNVEVEDTISIDQALLLTEGLQKIPGFDFHIEISVKLATNKGN